MELAKITDLNLLKAMAYDEASTIERSQANLQLLHQRISQLEVDNEETKPAENNQKPKS